MYEVWKTPFVLLEIYVYIFESLDTFFKILDLFQQFANLTKFSDFQVFVN